MFVYFLFYSIVFFNIIIRFLIKITRWHMTDVIVIICEMVYKSSNLLMKTGFGIILVRRFIIFAENIQENRLK